MRLVIRWLSIVALAGAVVMGVFQHRAIARASVEHQALLKDSEEADWLRRENVEIASLRATNKGVAGLEQKQRELARLRNEVVQLRGQAAEATKIRAENQRLASLTNGAPAAMPANYMPRTAMADVGLGSPEAAVQTLFHALAEGDVRRAMQCTGSKAELTNLTPAQEKDQSESMQREYAKFPGFLLVETNIISPDEVQIGVQTIPGGVAFPAHLIRIGNEWYVK